MKKHTIKQMQAEFQQQHQQPFQGFIFQPIITVTVQQRPTVDGEQQQQQQQYFYTFRYVPPVFVNANNFGSHSHGMSEQDIINHLFQQYQQQQKSKATDKKQLETLPVYTCDSSCKYQQQFGDCHKECTVCLCESSDKEKLMTLPCMHAFHVDCIKPWLESHNSCPVCRYELELSEPAMEQERKTKIRSEYGEEAIQLMDLFSKTQQLYSDYQIWNTSEYKTLSGLNKIESELTQTMYKVDSVLVPDDEMETDEKRTWDWNRVRQIRKQLVQRIQCLQEMIDSSRNKNQYSVNTTDNNN
jgi:hypothetical protein